MRRSSHKGAAGHGAACGMHCAHMAEGGGHGAVCGMHCAGGMWHKEDGRRVGWTGMTRSFFLFFGLSTSAVQMQYKKR